MESSRFYLAYSHTSKWRLKPDFTLDFRQVDHFMYLCDFDLYTEPTYSPQSVNLILLKVETVIKMFLTGPRKKRETVHYKIPQTIGVRLASSELSLTVVLRDTYLGEGP